MVPIIRREAFSDTTFLWEVHAPDVARAALPGHFVMLRLHEHAERIPLTVADMDKERGTITMVIQALGKSTRQMRDEYRQGDSFLDFVGPLGQPQHIEKTGHVVLVGGGLGVAPVFPQLRGFKQAGNRVTVRLTLTRKAKRKLRRSGRLRVKVNATATDAAGNKGQASKPVKIR